MARRITRMIRGRAVEVRQNVWLGTQITQTAIGANTVILAATLNAAALALRPFTIIRSHLLIAWASDQEAADEDALGVYAETIVSEQASAAGVASIPDPGSDADASWYVFQPMHQQFRFSSAAGFESVVGRQYIVDSKAMRKVGNNDDSVAVVSNNDATHGATIAMVGRFMIKLH